MPKASRKTPKRFKVSAGVNGLGPFYSVYLHFDKAGFKKWLNERSDRHKHSRTVGFCRCYVRNSRRKGEEVEPCLKRGFCGQLHFLATDLNRRIIMHESVHAAIGYLSWLRYQNRLKKEDIFAVCDVSGGTEERLAYSASFLADHISEKLAAA